MPPSKKKSQTTKRSPSRAAAAKRPSKPTARSSRRAVRRAPAKTAAKATRRAVRKGPAKAPARRRTSSRGAPAASRRGRKPAGPGPAEIERFVHRLPPPIRLLVNGMRALVRDVAPQVREILSAEGPAFVTDNIFARVDARDRDVLVEFLNAEALTAPPGLLESDAEGQPARFLRVKNVAQLKTRVLRALVRQAVSLAIAKPDSAASTLTGDEDLF